MAAVELFSTGNTSSDLTFSVPSGTLYAFKRGNLWTDGSSDTYTFNLRYFETTTSTSRLWFLPRSTTAAISIFNFISFNEAGVTARAYEGTVLYYISTVGATPFSAIGNIVTTQIDYTAATVYYSLAGVKLT